MRLLKSAVMVAVLAMAPCLALAADQKAPASQPKCPYLKAKQASGDQAPAGCPAEAAEGDKSCCKKADGCTKAEGCPKADGCKKADACPAKDGTCPKADSCPKTDGAKSASATDKPASGSCCKAKQPATAAK